MLDATEPRAIATICLLAALADGTNDDREREKLRSIFSDLGDVGETGIYQRVLLKKTDLESEAAMLRSPETRMYAYEMALHVCDSDGATTPAERDFLDRLRTLLELDSPAVDTMEQEAAAVAEAPLAGDDSAASLLPVPVAAAPQQAAPAADNGVEKMVLNYAILNAALELLPQSLATMAILPLQTKMVYRVGKTYGHELGRGHIKEFLAVIGAGMASQVVEDYVRKIFGGLVRKIGGKAAGKLAGTAAGSMTTFATTYAIGIVANRYYSSGRKLTPDVLRLEFGKTADQARLMYDKYRPTIEQNARTLDVKQVMQMVTGR